MFMLRTVNTDGNTTTCAQDTFFFLYRHVLENGFNDCNPYTIISKREREQNNRHPKHNNGKKSVDIGHCSINHIRTVSSSMATLLCQQPFFNTASPGFPMLTLVDSFSISFHVRSMLLTISLFMYTSAVDFFFCFLLLLYDCCLPFFFQFPLHCHVPPARRNFINPPLVRFYLTKLCCKHKDAVTNWYTLRFSARAKF